MNKTISIIISIILLFSFTMGICCAGTNKTYDFKSHLYSIANVTEEFPRIEELGYIWYADTVVNEAASDIIESFPGITKVIHLREWPYGLFGANGYQTDPPVSWMTFDVWFSAWDDPNNDTPVWEGLQPLIDVIEGTTTLFARTSFTVLWLGNYVVSFFELVFALSPTSGIVERGAF